MDFTIHKTFILRLLLVVAGESLSKLLKLSQSQLYLTFSRPPNKVEKGQEF